MMIIDPPTLKRKTTQFWRTDKIAPEFEWIHKLSPLHFRLFLVDFHDAVSSAVLSEDWDRVIEVLEDWEATSEVDSDPELAAYLLSDPSEKEYEELDLATS